MKEASFTIFQYSKPRGPTPATPRNNEEADIAEKGGKAIIKVNNELEKPQNHNIVPQSPELVEIKEPRSFNIQIQPQRDEAEILRRLKKRSNRLVISISSKFPLDFFPTKINIQETRVSVIFHDFLSTHVHSMDIKDISNVFIESAYYFANLTLITRTFIENDVKVPKLKKEEAIYARRLIEGLRIFASEKIDTSNYEIPELIEKLEGLSEAPQEI